MCQQRKEIHSNSFYKVPQTKQCKFLDQSQAQKSYLERTVRRDTNFDLAQPTKDSRNIENRLLYFGLILLKSESKN